MRQPRSEKVNFDKMERELYSAVISDVLDEMGIRNHTLNVLIRPLRANMVLAGRAKPMVASKVFEMPEEPYKIMIEALDSLKQDEVPLIVASSGSSTAMWGELFSTASQARGARGAVIDGFARDTRKILEMDYQLFCAGMAPTDSKGREQIISYGRQVRSGDATVAPGDIIFADLDGVVAIPREVEDDVLTRARKKAGKENLVRDDLRSGKMLADSWRKHGVL